jgi:hypothetical protein
VACGVAAAEMARSGQGSAALLGEIGRLQALVAKQTPIDWTMPK